MKIESVRPIVHIAAAVIRDEIGRFLLVRKRETQAYMQAGGKIEAGEQPVTALLRELQEELGLVLRSEDTRYLGVFEADAANEPGHLVRAELFEVMIDKEVAPAAEIAEAIWTDWAAARELPLAPLTRMHVLRLHG